jgi:RNA polymerase subunit RPABC4/transcription elongation factor Spt4
VEEVDADMPKKKEVPVVVKEPEEEEVTCPVCGKLVGLDVTECPHCGAEFEEEEIEEVVEAKPAKASKAKPPPVVEEEPVEEDEMAECPVCGKMVSLAVSACPSCGAEFEEEEVEEIIEVEEKRVAVAPPPRAAPHKVIKEEPVEAEVVEEAEEVQAEPADLEIQSNITDLRVIGIALIVLGIIGSQISFMIDWYYTWVPPIGDNLGMFIAIPAVVIVVALLVFLLIRKAAGEGKKVPMQMPGMSMSLFLFGIFALVMIMLWSPINDALQSSNAGVGIMFVVFLVVGIVMVFMKMRTESRASA